MVGQLRANAMPPGNATGMTADEAGRIFNDFYTTKQGGTGLGLSLSHDIITKGHGGKLTFETVEGQYYQIETSSDQQNWVPDGNVLIGHGFPVYRTYVVDEKNPRFFRVVTE